MKFDNWSIRSSSPSEERVDEFSVRTITSSLKTEDKEGNFEDRVSPTDEVIWSGTSESKYQVSYSSESRTPSSHGTSSSLSLFHSEVKEFFLSHRGYENEHETAQFSSRKLFAILKTNKNNNPAFSSDFNFSRRSSISRESEGLDMAPCPPAHLFLSRDQVRLLEETVRNQIPLKPKTILESKTTCPYSRPQESLIQNQHSFGMHIPTQAQDSFPVQNAIQNQGFYEARFTSQAQQFVNNQESVNSQPDIMARYFALPQDLIRKPFSSSRQDSFQTQVMGRSQHLVNVPHSVETQHSIKGLESDNKHLHETQYSSVWFEDSNQIKHLTQGQNVIFKNARFLVLTVSPNSFAEGMLQIRSVKPEGQKQIASSELNQYSVYSSVPLSLTFKRQKNWRKALHGKSKLSRKVSSQKLKKPPTPWVFQMTVCHTSKPGKLRCKYNAKKKELHPRKGISDIALHLLYFSKLVPPYIKRYSRKKLVEVMPGVTGRRHSLLKQNKSLDAENVSCVGSVEKRGTSGNAKNVKHHGRENEGQKNISAKLPSWLEESFMVNTFPLKAPCSLLIETNWKNKQSLKDPITQEKEIGIAEFHAPNSKKTSDLHIPKHESPLEEAISEPWQKFASSPEMESNRRMKTQEDLKSTENSHLPLSNGEELPTNSPETQRCFPNRNIQKERDFLEIVLETSEVNLLISLGTKEHKSSEQVASVKTQESTEDTVMKEKKPLILHVTECDDPSESERLQCNTRSNINMQDKRIFATFHNATDTTISGPPVMEIQSRLKAKTDTSTTGFSHSVVEQEKLPDEKKASDAKYIEERCIKKPQEHDREEEEPTLQEAVPQLKQDFRVSLQLKQKPKYVRFEIKQSSSGSRKNPNKEQEVQPQTLSTETVVGTGSCPTMDPCQVQVKQITDRPTGRETADAKNPLTVLENSPVGGVLTDTTERDVPFGGSPRKIPDDHIAEEKEDLKRVFPAAALGLFIIRTLPLSSFKRQKIRRKWSGAKTVLGPKLVIMKVKKPANLLMPNISRNGIPSLRRRLRGNFKIITKQILQDKIVSDVLVNVTYPHMSTVPRIRTHSRLSVENPGHTKPNQEESEDEREEKHSNFINKGNDSGNTLEEAKLQDEVRGDEAARPEAVLHGPWHLRLNANPEKEFKTEEEMPQPVTSGESLVESVDTPIMDLFHVENMKKSLATQADLKRTADAEIPLPTSGKSVIGDPLNQTRESDVLDYGKDTREMGYFFADTKAELPKDLPAMYSETFNCHMPVLTHSKVNKNRVRFSHTECPVKPKSVPMNTVKLSVSQVFNRTGHRKKLDSEAKAKLEKINQANGLVYDFISSLFSPMHSRLQGETNSFCHAQLKQGQLAEEVRPRYVDFFDKCSAFHEQEEKVKDGEEVEQKTLLEAALQHTQHLWPDACQGKETHLDEQYTALSSLTQEQDAQHQTWFAQTALQTSLQMAPREGEELEKPSQTEHAITAPMGAKSPPPKAENSSFDNIFNTMTECDLPSGGNPKRVLDSYFVENNSELPKDLQVTCLHSSGSVEPFVSKSERKENTLELARKQITANHRYRTIRGKKPSASHMLNGTQSKGLQCNFKTKMKKPQQNKNAADAFLNIIQSRVPILPNTKMSSRLNVETDMQRVTGLDYMQLMQEKLLNGGKVCCPDHIVSTLSNSMKDGKEKEGKHEVSPAPENSQSFIFNVYQKENFDLVQSDEELKQPRSRNLQVQPQMHGTQTVLSYASCPILDQLQFGELESYAAFSPPKSEEVKNDEIVFSAREHGVPSDANHQKEQAGGVEKKDTVTFDSCLPALSTPQRNFKYSDKKTSVNTKYGLLKAKKLSVSNIFNIKGAVSPNHRKELGCNPTTKMKEVHHGEKMAAKMYSFMTITPDINTYNKIEREKDTLGERSLRAKQVKQATSPLEGNSTSDDTKENSVQDEEEETGDQEILKVISQHSTHFKFCSGQREELDLHQSENQGSGKILFVIEQDIPQQMQPTDSMLGEKPKKSHHPQNGAIYIASSKLPPLKSKDSLIGQVLLDTVKGGVPSVGSHMGELYHHGKEENAEFKKNLEATVLEYSEVSTPDLSESKRQRKTFTCRTLKNQMSPKCVIMKARKTPISTIFSISGNGCLKNLPPKTLKSQNIDFLIPTKCSGVPEDLIAEKKEGLAQEFPATILESLDLSTLALPALKRRRNQLKYIEKRKKMSLKWVTLKTKKPPISQTLRITKRGIPSHRRQFKCNFSIMMKQGKPVADKTLNAVSSPIPVALDMKMHNRIKAESDVLWTMRFSHERQQQELPPDGERASGAFSSDKRGGASRGMKEVKGQREEAAPRSSQHFSSITGKMEETRCVRSELELENSARKKIPEPLNTAQEQQQQTLFTQSVLHCVSCTILNSLPVEKLPKRTKAQKGLKYAKSPKLLSPELGKSVRESLIITTQSDIPSERGPRKELARSTPEGKRRLQKDLQGRTLKFLDFSTPASSDFRGWRKTPQIPKSRTGKAQMASILKTIHIARSAALSHGKEQDCVLENMAPEISQGMSDIFMNTYLSHTPVSPAIKTHQKIKAKKDPLRNKSSISQLEQHEGEKLCPYSSNNGSNSSSTSESRWQSGKEREGVGVLFEAGLHFLCSTGRRKDQNMFITEQEVQRQTVVSENKLESTCPPLIPLHIQELRKNIPPQKDIPHRLGQKIPCPKSGTALLDYFSTDGAKCSAKSDASPARKLDVHMAVSLRPEDKGEGIKTHKVVKHRVDQNIPPTKSGNSVLGDPGDGSSRRKMRGRIARKHRELQRDLLTTSTTSVFSDSMRQEKVLKFPGRKNLTGPKCVTMKAKKPLCSQMLHITEHDNLYCRKEQDGNLKSSIKDKQQNKSIANAFLSPAPVSADNKIDIEMQSTSKAETDQLRVNLHSHIPAKRRKSPCDREAWNQASSTDMQNRSSKTMKMNVQHEKEEENIRRMLLDSVPHCGQHHRFSADQMKNPGSSQSTSELNHSEVRRTWNLPWTAQKMRQEECFRETVSEPVSRHMMTFLQVETEKKGLSTQEGIKCMERVKTPLPKARKSETASIQCGTLWDGNPRRHWDSPISGKKAWNQNDLVRTVLKPSDFSSLDSSVPKSQSYALEFVSKRSIVSSKHVTLKAKKRPSSQLLNTTRCITGSHRKKKGCTFQYKMKGRQWIESVVEASLPAAEGTEIPPSKIVTDKHSFDTIARSTIYNRTLHKNLRGHTTEEKAELGENSATTFLGPLDFFTPILSDPESQKNTVQLLEEKITLNINCSIMKKKELAISQIPKIRRQFTTKYRDKPGSNLKTKMKQMRQDKNVANTFPNTTDFTPDAPDLRRQSRLKTGIDRGSQFRHTQPTHRELPTEGLVISQLLHATSHAALSNNERQEKKIDMKREKTVLRVDLKSVYDSMPIFSHIKMESSPSTWGISEESSEKGNALNKPNASSAYACTPVYLQIVKHKAMAKTADVKNSMHTKRVKLKAKKLPVSQLCHTIGCRTRRNKKEQTCNMKKQKREFWQDKTVTDLLLSTICDSGSGPSQIKQFTEVKREKDRPRKPLYTPPQRKLEKSLSQRKMSSSESTDIKNTISRNIKTLKQCIRAQKENHQTLLLDILPQCKDQLVIGQQVKKELDPVKIGVTLEREVYPGLSSQKRDIDYPRFDAPRVKKLTGCEFLVAQRVKEEDIDMVERSVSIPSGRQVSEKTDASLSSKGQNIFLTELNASQQKTCKEQELPKQGSVSVTNLGSVAYPIMEPSRLENTGKVAEEEMYTSKKNISHLLGREDIEETDIFQGSKGQKFLYTNLVAQQNISAVQKGEVEPDDILESTVDSISCPNRDNHFQITQVVNTRKEDVSIPINLYVNPWRKEQSQVTDSPLRLNEKKKIFSEKLKAKQLHRSNQNKENILESISSRIVHRLHNNKLKKNVSAKGRSSKVLSSVVDEASNKADTPVDQPPCSEGVDLHNRRRKEPQKESTCKALPTSVSYSLTDVLQMKLPCVKEVLKAPMYHTSNTEGIGLPVEGKEEKQPECIHQISPKPASHSLRDIFQSKMPCKEKASKEVVSTMDYIPSTEQIGSFITRQDSKVRIGKGKPCMKLTSLCASLPSLPHTDVNSRIKVGQGKSGILKSCLLPLKSQVSSSVRKTQFAKSINRDSLSRVIESKHLPQGKKEDGENIVYVKDIMGLKCVTFKGKKTPFKYILHGKEPQWNNKEQEETMQKDKSDLDMVQNKHHASFPSSPHLERMPGIKEVLMRGIAGFCLPSLTLKELSDAMGVREEPTDDILSSIKKAKYMPRRDRVEMSLEEIMQPKRIALKVKQSPITQELQLNIKENEKNMQEHKDNQVGIRNTSCISVSFPSYSEVDIRITGEETRLIKRRSSFLQPELQESSDIEKIAYKESVYGDISSSINKAKEHIMQEEEERVKKEEVIPFREKTSPISQETQLDIEEQETNVQKIKDEPNVLVSDTSPCIIAPSHLKLGTRIKTADSLTEVARYCIPELSHQKSSDAVKKANKESIDDHAASDEQEAKDYVPQKEESDVEISAERDVMHPKDKDLKRKQALSQDIPPDLKEQVNVDLKSEEQGRMEGGGKGEREVVLPTHGASESSLSHHELDTRIEGEEDSQGITRPAVSQLLLQKSFEAGKTAYTKSTGDDILKDLRVVQEYEPEKGEDGRKIVNMKYLMYPIGTTSKEKVLPLPHVLYTSGSCGSQIVEVQTNMKEKLGNLQERSKLDKLLTRTSLPPFKLNKGIGGKEEKEGVTRPSLPPSWHKESSHAEELKYTVPPLNGIASSSKRTEYMTQTEEEKANTFEEDIMHPRYIALRAKKSPLFLILKTKKLQVNIKEQGEVGQEDNEDTVVLLSRIHPFITSSTHLKWDTIKDEEGEPGIIRNDVDITVFDTLGGKKEQALLVPEQKECILESCQKPLPSHWTFPAQSEDLEGKNKMDTSTIINLEQKTLELEEGELKIDTNIAICLEKDKTEMHKHIIVSLEENLKRDTNNVVNGNTPSPKAEESQINTQVITRIGNSCPIKQKHKKDLEVPGAKQNIQPRKMFQKHILDSFYAYIPLSLKFEGREGRLTIADLKRELSPKYLTMKIQNHPISQILNNTGRGIPSNRKKLEYDFSGPKKTVLWREDTSGICIRSLSISTVNSSQTEETAESETNLEREKILCLSEFQQKSPSTSDVKRNSSSIVKEGCPPFPPLSKSETNLSHEAKENILIPQTKEENVVPGPDSSRIIKEPYLLMTEKEKAPKPILTPTECPLMSDDPKDSVETHMESTLSMNISLPGVEETQHGAELLDIMGCASPPEQGDQSEPIQDTTTPKVQQQKTFPGSGPVPSQVKSNETKVVAERTSAESLLPLYEAVKNILESQIKNMIQDKICEDILEKIKAHKPDAWKSPSFAGSSDTTSTTKPPKLQPKLILERLLPKENNKLTNHLESKAFEIKLNLIPEIAKKSFHKFSFYLKQSISEHNSWRLYPRHKKMCFLSLEGIDATEPNLNQKYPKDSPPVRCMKTLIVNVSSDGKEIIANRKSIRKLESGASSATSANEMPLTPILPNYSAEEKDKLFVHFSIKTLEIQMTAFPRIVRESYTMANAQNTKKRLSKFVNSGTKVPKRKNKILLLFEEKSLHQIDLDLRYKYLHFLLGLPVKSMFPKPNALPKHILKLNTVAICKNRDYRGESGGGLCIDTEPLVQHISSKKQSPHENSSLMKKFLKPTHVCASNADQQGTAQKDSTVLSELKSHVTPEKDKQCHGWFQETNTYKYFDPKTQESAPHLVDSHSIPISEDSAESQTNIESLANLEACSALEVYGSKECMFLEANPYLSQESQNILFELQKGIPLENLYKMRKSKTNLKPFYREYSGSHHGVRGCRKHSSIVTPSYESHKSRKYGSSDTTPFSDWLCYGSLNTVDVPSSSSSVPFSEGKSSWSAGHRTTYSLAPLMESNIKLHLAKSQGKPYSHLESKERKKAKLDLFRKNNLHWDCDYSYTQNKEKCTRKKKVCNCESERLNHYASKPKLPSKPHQEDVYFHSESKQNQPFFYACIPADSLEIMPQTIRWTIPPRTLKKTNFRVPLVAKISSSCNIWTSSKKLLGSLLESFSPVHPNGYNHI
uniref:Coiled-coil domain-containing protein n=1 Tax=Felis catus TaxID=9685 RepID=A0ABI7WFE7_FELCA